MSLGTDTMLHYHDVLHFECKAVRLPRLQSTARFLTDLLSHAYSGEVHPEKKKANGRPTRQPANLPTCNSWNVGWLLQGCTARETGYLVQWAVSFHNVLW